MKGGSAFPHKQAPEQRSFATMSDVLSSGEDAERRLAAELVAQYDVPAYIRRARGVEAALEALLAACRGQRDRWLMMTRLRLGRLHALAGEWAALRPLLAEDDLAALEGLFRALEPKLRAPVARTQSRRVLRRALAELVESLERFNQRWGKHLAGLDLSAVNQARDGYNRYYVLEKECALRSAALARLGFRPLPPLTHAEVAALLPPLPVPRLA
jgi:hypothetical protein